MGQIITQTCDFCNKILKNDEERLVIFHRNKAFEEFTKNQFNKPNTRLMCMSCNKNINLWK